MPHEVLDFSQRAELTELMDEPCQREELHACLRDLAKVNRWFLGYRPVLSWLETLNLDRGHKTVHILDAGCGYGDGLRRIGQWADERDVTVKLTGCDLNPDTIAIAAEASVATKAIEWIAQDVFSLDGRGTADIIVSALFTHHLKENDIVRFLRWMEEHARIGWFINDLSRAAVPYWLFKAFAKVAGLHRFVQHDGPVSFRRAFVADDWIRMCAAAGLEQNDFRIEPWKPARLCVSRTKR